MKVETEIERILTKLFLGFSEIMGMTLAVIITTAVGALFYYIRKHLYGWLRIIGIHYFSERLKNIRDINSDLIWIQGAFNADVYGLFRTYNGKSYVEDNFQCALNETDSKKLKQYDKIKVRKMNSKPDDFFPDFLNKDLYKYIIDKTVVNDWKFFSYESLKAHNPNSPLLVFLEAEFINNILTFRIWDKYKKTYGIILFAWNKEPAIEELFTKQISKKLDSIAIRLQIHIESSLSEKIGFRWLW